MKNRIYYCPICKKTYISLTAMYNCAKKCEEEEKAQEAQKAQKDREIQERIKAEKDISKQYETLKAAITKYNVKYKDFSYEFTLRHHGPAAFTNKTNEITDSEKNITKNFKNLDKTSVENGLEEFLKTNTNIKETQKKNINNSDNFDNFSQDQIVGEIADIIANIIGTDTSSIFKDLCDPSSTTDKIIKKLINKFEE